MLFELPIVFYSQGTPHPPDLPQHGVPAGAAARHHRYGIVADEGTHGTFRFR